MNLNEIFDNNPELAKDEEANMLYSKIEALTVRRDMIDDKFDILWQQAEANGEAQYLWNKIHDNSLGPDWIQLSHQDDFFVHKDSSRLPKLQRFLDNIYEIERRKNQLQARLRKINDELD